MADIPPSPLRDEIKVRKLTQGGETIYILKEPDKGAYYRFDEAQYQMLALLDGRKTPEQLVEAFNQASEEYEFDLSALNELLESAREYQLLKRSKKEENAALVEKMREERRGRRLQAEGNLLMMRFQLVDPNDTFNRIVDRVAWIWSPAGVKASFALIGVAILMALMQGERFLHDFEKVFLLTQQGAWGFLGVWAVALFAIGLHEVGHGLTCKHFGGDVNDMGFLLMAFQPCLYCNVNDAWLFENRRHKIFVALAGVWVELVLSALSVFIWTFVDVEHLLGRIAFIIVTISTASSLFLNLNPLMKFDGYYIMSDSLEVPNLRQNAIAWFSYHLKKFLFRIKDEPPLHPTQREKRIYFIYGMLTVSYLTLMMLGLAFMGYQAMASGYGSWGVMLFFYLAAKLARRMTGSWSKTLGEWIRSTFMANKRQLAGIGVAGLLLAGLMFTWSPPVNILTQGKVEAELRMLHAPENGFAEQVAYGADRRLTAAAGAPLFRVRSPELLLEEQKLQATLETLFLDSKRAITSSDRALLQRTTIETRSTEKQLEAVRQRMQALTVPTPDGEWRVDGPPPENVEGRYFAKGSPVLTLIPAQRWISVILEQSDLSLVSKGNRARINLAGAPAQVYSGTVRRVSPVSKVEGPVRLFQVRIQMEVPEGTPPPPLDLTGQVRILGNPQPLWVHVLRPIRGLFRADLWI